MSPAITYRAARNEKRQPTYVLFISSKRDTKNIIKIFKSSILSPLAGNKLEQFNTWVAWHEKRYEVNITELETEREN